MAEIGDLVILDGAKAIEKPAIIIEAETARRAREEGELDDLVRDAYAALKLSGKNIVYVEASDG